MIRRIDASISSIVGSPRESAITLPLPAQILFSGRANRPRRLRLRGLARPPIGNAASHPTVVGVGIIERPAFQPQVPRLRLSDRRSEEHTSELQSLMRISYAVLCLKKKKQHKNNQTQSKQL